MLKLAKTLAWNIEIISHYIFSAAEIINKLTMIGKIGKVVRLYLDQAEFNKIRFGIQSKIQGLAELVSIPSQGVTVLLKHLSELLKDASSAYPMPAVRELHQDHAYIRDGSMCNTRVNYQKIRNALAPTLALEPKIAKRIEFSEILGEVEENEDDTLIST